MSAAVEFLACEHCGEIVRGDLFERYEVTERRLENAIERIVGIIMKVNPSTLGGGEDEGN